MDKKRIIIKLDATAEQPNSNDDVFKPDFDNHVLSTPIDNSTLQIRWKDFLLIFSPLLTLFSMVVHNLYLHSESIKLHEHKTLKTFFLYSKRNIMNVIFIKNGLFWIYILILANRLVSSTKGSGFLTRIFKVYSFWYVTIVSMLPFSGLQSLTELIFTFTGGECILGPEDVLKHQTKKNIRKVHTLKQCKKLKGKWLNGHDLSGHLFFLSLMIWVVSMEIFELSGTSHNKTLKYGYNLRLFIRIFATFLILIYGYNIMITILNEFHGFGEIMTGFIWGHFGGYAIYHDFL
ncbi:hypothetical protein QEN19_000248 [Hanseniaspora menglaensis]